MRVNVELKDQDEMIFVAIRRFGAPPGQPRILSVKEAVAAALKCWYRQNRQFVEGNVTASAATRSAELAQMKEITSEQFAALSEEDRAEWTRLHQLGEDEL